MNGEEHVQQARAACTRLREQAASLAQPGGPWPPDWPARLDGLSRTLAGLEGRFFLRSRLCLPFAARCAEEGRRVEEALAALADAPGDQSREGAAAALAAWERAARVLDERSRMDGMAIT